jgi:uncharacterized protein (TIGR03086 family)
MNAPTDVVDGLARAAAHNAELMAAMRPDQLDALTPCRQWTARDLTNHIVGGQLMFRAAADGEPLASLEPPNVAATDPAAAQRRATAALVTSLRDPGLAQREAVLAFGTVPGSLVAPIAFFEQVVHGWDLARATGQDATIDPNVANALLPVAEQLLANVPRDGVAFAVAVDVPAGASAGDRIIALSGRQP